MNNNIYEDLKDIFKVLKSGLKCQVVIFEDYEIQTINDYLLFE